MLLTDTAAPAGPATDQIWPWVLLVSIIAMIAVLALCAFQVRRTQKRASEAAARDARTIEETRDRLAHAEVQVGQLRSAVADRERAVRDVQDQILPLVMQRVRTGTSPETLLTEFDQQGVVDAATRPLVEEVTRSIWKGHRQRATLLSVVRGCADRARAGVAQLRADVQERSQPYWSGIDATASTSQMREDLMVVEAGLSRLEMLIQRLLTLAEAERIGRNWTQPLRIERLVRAAIGTVPSYQRVQMRSPSSPILVEGRAVNAIIQVLAELIDNATSFSAPSEAVVVHFESTALRLGVRIDDSGLAMEEDQLQVVRRRLDPSRRPDISGLSANQLGLLVVRRAADPLGIRVDIGPSPRGGTRTTVWIPRNGILHVDANAGSLPKPRPAPPKSSPDDWPTPIRSVNSSRPFTRTKYGDGPPIIPLPGEPDPPAPAESAAPAAPDTSAPAAPTEPATPDPLASPAPPDPVSERSQEGTAERPKHLPRRRRGASISDESHRTRRTVEPPRDQNATSHRIAAWYAHTRPNSAPPSETREDS